MYFLVVYCCQTLLLSLQKMIKLKKAIKQTIGYSMSFFAIPVASMANPYIKAFNQQLGTASTGEKVELLEAKVVIRGGYGTMVKYRIGSDIVETSIYCPEDEQPYFLDQGVRYAQSVATQKLLSLACRYEQEIVSSR